MSSILKKLQGGDGRSIGRSEEVVRDVSKNSLLVASLFAGLLDNDPVVRIRAADALEKATRRNHGLFQPWKRQLLGAVSALDDKEVRWYVAQMLPRLRLTPTDRETAVRTLMGYLQSDSSIVKTFSMQALADLASQDERLLEEVTPLEVTPLPDRLTRAGTPAMKSRGRKLSGQLSGLGNISVIR